MLPLSARGLVFARAGRRLIDDIDFTLEGAGITLIMGHNGAGKSLLLRLLAGLVEPDAGTVTWNGRAPDRARATRVGFVFQKPVLLRRSALGNVVHALKCAGVKRAERKLRAHEALQRARLAPLAGVPARLMSGGEQQRLALARALALRPRVLMLDEPTASLDPTSVAHIEALALEAVRAGTRILFVGHDLAQARRLADEVVFMHSGRIAERTPAATFFDNPQSPLAARFLAGDLLLDEDRKLKREEETTP
ncbi:ATP-binding cassette domain-containing protein [Breoghania corrubedonensis]|uniref:ATP-binding cassette domain-containing protein n=1 Tax=Breoghania corrubedonensis TaxID=665038 RepID=UPI001FEA6CAD|nr:ATP-binding cassette domain-containing protein [Breoghania corrubedonensis]